MKLKITDYFWSVGNPTSKVKTVYSSLEVGVIKEMGEISATGIAAEVSSCLFSREKELFTF